METKQPICVAIHGRFAGDTYQQLLKSGAAKIVTCNTISHVTNQIDLSRLIAENAKIYLNQH